MTDTNENAAESGPPDESERSAEPEDSAEAGTAEDDGLSEEERRLMSHESEPAPAPSSEGEGIRVLVAGSRPLDVSELRAAMEQKGMEVRCVSDFGEAAGALGEEQFDVVVVALAAENPKALGILRELAAHENSGATLLATRRPTPGLVFQAARAGADYVVVVPPSPSALDHIVAMTRTRIAA